MEENKPRFIVTIVIEVGEESDSIEGHVESIKKIINESAFANFDIKVLGTAVVSVPENATENLNFKIDIKEKNKNLN